MNTLINRLGRFGAIIKVAAAKLNSAGLLQFSKRLSNLSGKVDGMQLKLRLGSREGFLGGYIPVSNKLVLFKTSTLTKIQVR